MFNNLDINQYLKGIYSSAAINAAHGRSVGDNHVNSSSEIDMQFNNVPGLTGTTKSWVT